jgi:hypothetical protein
LRFLSAVRGSKTWTRHLYRIQVTDPQQGQASALATRLPVWCSPYRLRWLQPAAGVLPAAVYGGHHEPCGGWGVPVPPSRYGVARVLPGDEHHVRAPQSLEQVSLIVDHGRRTMDMEHKTGQCEHCRHLKYGFVVLDAVRNRNFNCYGFSFSLMRECLEGSACGGC